jgi:16S rRNA (cytosine1402-N4)-methyltransferase
VSSHHFDDATRGFSFRFDAPLDMRMNRSAGMTAADVVNDYDEKRLADVIYLYGELKSARRMAAAIVKARQQGRIATTGQLLQAVGMEGRLQSLEASPATEGLQSLEAKDGQWKKDAAKLFQALRIEVNHEMDALRDMLLAATQLLKPGGRLSVITYHSLEDRIVKNVMRCGNTEGKMEKDFFGRVSSPLRLINNKVVTPSAEELEANPRSRSAKLRVAEKV